MQEIFLQKTNKMTFTEQDKLKALAIVSIFETSKPFGSYAACVVLNDGAGVSYGIAQFTHRSGSLWEVVDRYLNAGGQIGREVLAAAIPLLKRIELEGKTWPANNFAARRYQPVPTISS